MASLTRINVRASPFAMMSFRSAAFSHCRIREQAFASTYARMSFGRSTNGAGAPSSASAGSRSTMPG